ncbi:pogo transposable element with KRAB domain isoform X2 [Rhizophagus clarus]|uniref:Pogo transposable element with KRAB domain isoform X2 n=2 Tax=Rhizophagus clarus TaxID=94130 RepID=A0A8H3L9A4_9GLOM|nr:pogo transposable element with KRAB domain isoform X2 [Rhizophagus clarus]
MYHENGHSKRKTADKFNIQAKQLRVKPKYPALETALVTWVKEKRKNQNAITRNGFMNQNKLSNRHRTTIAQRLPKDLIEKQQSFLAFIMYRRIQHDYPLAYIGNMDETPVSFDLPTNTTVDELDARSVSIRITYHERTNFTVVLTFLDSFSAHIVDSVKRRFSKKKTDIAVIPEGLTSRLQPLDVSVNKSFKSKMRRRYNEWIAETIKDLTPTGIIKRPTYETIAHWVKDSWEAVDVNLIQRSFKCYGISNNRDGTEDGWIFNYDRLEQQASKPNNEVAPLSDKEDKNTSDEGYETDTSEEEHETEGSDEEFGNNENDEESENDKSDEEHGNRINLMRVNMRR